MVLAVADEVRARFDRLDVLVNNAGIDVGSRQVTADGLELTFAVNYMAPFMLTTALAELLKESAPARILNVVSSGHKQAGSTSTIFKASIDSAVSAPITARS